MCVDGAGTRRDLLPGAGGPVVKNVAGFDVPRLMPRPADEHTLARHCTLPQALAAMGALPIGPGSVSGAAWIDGRLLLRVRRLVGIEVVQSFHAGDGNQHSVLRDDSQVPVEETRAMALADGIMKLALAHGGSVSGEHGIGTEKLHGMCWQFSADELAVFHGIRRAWDPAGILKPGKAIPELHRCAEFGAMHLRRGEVPHADLPRF